MKKITITVAALVIAVGFGGAIWACNGDKAAADTSGCCPKSAAKAAYDSTLDKTGCEKTAKAAYKNELAEKAYDKSLAESGCAKTAAKAAHDAVLADTGCAKSAAAASGHAVAQAAYDETLKKTGCSKTAKAAYDESVKSAEKKVESVVSDTVS